MDLLELSWIESTVQHAGKRYDTSVVQTKEEADTWWRTPEALARRVWALTAPHTETHRTPADRTHAIKSFFAGLGLLPACTFEAPRETEDETVNEPVNELRDMLRTTLRHHRGNLSAWEESFFISVLQQVDKGRRLSDKQRAIVERVVAKTSRLVSRKT